MAAEVETVPGGALVRLQVENEALRDRLESAERYTAQTLARATRLSQVISVLANDAEFDTVVGRAAVEVAELFSADIALLMLGPDHAVSVEGHWGVRARDVPAEPFPLAGLDGLTPAEPVHIGPASDIGLPSWLGDYGATQVAWARLLVGEESLGLMLLIRRGPEPFERSDEKELRAIAYRIALAMENGLLHRRTGEQLARLHRIQALTTQLAGTLELDAIGGRVAEMLVSELPVAASAVLIDRDGERLLVGRAAAEGVPEEEPDDTWDWFPLETGGKPVGCVAVAVAPRAGSEERELLVHLLGLAALALDKALLYARSREQARQTGDDALRLVAEALRREVRGNDSVFRVGGEEFCAALPGLEHADAFRVAERLRLGVAEIVSGLPVTVSLGVASYPLHAETRDELLTRADTALYASKRAGKNRTTVAGDPAAPAPAPVERHVQLAMLHDRDPGTVVHSVRVATIAVDVARALGVPNERLPDLRTAARLHDLGKIAVPDAILNKPGALDEEEFRIVKTHPVVGAELLRAWGCELPAKFVLQHHERIDGTGYPPGLRGDQITLESRILHAADAYVAMTLDRPYRAAMGREEAVAELLHHRGTQFDADVIDALVAMERGRERRTARTDDRATAQSGEPRRLRASA